MAEAEDVCDLRIEQGVDDWEHLEEKRIRIEKSFKHQTLQGYLGEDNTGLGKVFVENPDLCLISGVLHQCGQNSKNQHLEATDNRWPTSSRASSQLRLGLQISNLCDVISEYVGVKEYVVVVGHAGSLLPCIGWTRGSWANLQREILNTDWQQCFSDAATSSLGDSLPKESVSSPPLIGFPAWLAGRVGTDIDRS